MHFLKIVAISMAIFGNSLGLQTNPLPKVENTHGTDVRIVGAGIAGLASALLIKKSDPEADIVIIEKRRHFTTRKNIINLGIEVEKVLEELGILKQFQDSCGVRLKSHFLLPLDSSRKKLDLIEDHVENLQYESLNLDELEASHFRSGVYSVSIGQLQEFLLEEVRDKGIPILEGTLESETSQLFSDGFPLPESGLNIITSGFGSQINHFNFLDDHPCQNEKWIFANLDLDMNDGETESNNPIRSFVISTFDIKSNKSDFQQLSNNIFRICGEHSKLNVALTIKEDNIDSEQFKTLILDQASYALKIAKQEGLIPKSARFDEHLGGSSLNRVISIHNGKNKRFIQGNTIFAGDAAGVSSPLAGLGGTLALGVYPLIIRDFYLDRDEKRFKRRSNAATSSWLGKSAKVRKFIKSYKR